MMLFRLLSNGSFVRLLRNELRCQDMEKRMLLDDSWTLQEAPLAWGPEMLGAVSCAAEGRMACTLPCDLRIPLIREGKIGDPVTADFSFESRWIEERSWWFRREFDLTAEEAGTETAELVLESIDAHGDVFLNGVHLGTHISAFYPFCCGVSKLLRKGKNELMVRVTTGLETVSDRDLAEVGRIVTTEADRGYPERGDLRRSMLRKPAYTVGWDWGPRAVSCGIMKEVYLLFRAETRVSNVHMRTAEILPDGAVKVEAELTVEHLPVFSSCDADVSLVLTLGGEEAARAGAEDILLTSGENTVRLAFTVPDARLWWPNGMGEQTLYTVHAEVRSGGAIHQYPPFEIGLRTLELDVTRQDTVNRKFAFRVNGGEIFCKGADWIPADAIYARVSPEKYEKLVDEAAAANFNMLRVWGGGFYEYDAFYEACDRRGILLWHDFMFGCSAAPDHLDWYRREVERELDYQTKRLANHPCIALWCGNNENHWILDPAVNPQWDVKPTPEKQYGLFTSNVLARRAVRQNCPEIPYWNSSPYGGAQPNDFSTGDVHIWKECMMNPDVEKRIDPAAYDSIEARFVSEYGYPGPIPMESIRTYFAGVPVDRNTRIWNLHNNAFEKTTVNAGIRKHYLDDAESLDLEGYLLYAGLVQSLMLGYSLEAIRFQETCGGALFWMYSDTWGEVGWTIVDYYLRRKVSYYGVKRALAHVKLTLRSRNGRVILAGANDTGDDVELQARAGYLAFDGAVDETVPLVLRLPARSRSVLTVFELPERDYTTGSFAVIPESGPAAPELLRMGDFRNLVIPAPDFHVETRDVGEDLICAFRASVYCHAVHAEEELDFSDNYFDLLPGETRTVRIRGAAGEHPAWTAVVHP